jgi:hypothetical protein
VSPARRWFYALTFKGDSRHVYLPEPGEFIIPGDATALCGKLIRYRLRAQKWANRIPRCPTCVRLRVEGRAG